MSSRLAAQDVYHREMDTLPQDHLLPTDPIDPTHSQEAVDVAAAAEVAAALSRR